MASRSQTVFVADTLVPKPGHRMFLQAVSRNRVSECPSLGFEVLHGVNRRAWYTPRYTIATSNAVLQ